MTQTERRVRRTSINKIGVVTVVIPRKFAKDCDLEVPTDIVIEKTSEGLFIRKLEVQ